MPQRQSNAVATFTWLLGSFHTPNKVVMQAAYRNKARMTNLLFLKNFFLKIILLLKKFFTDIFQKEKVFLKWDNN